MATRKSKRFRSENSNDSMAENDLVDALRALTTTMVGQQQQQAVIQQQQNATFQAAILAQQADLQALLAVQQQNIRQQDRLRSSATASIPSFAGKTGESLEDWLTIVSRVAAAENWDEANKQRVAIGKLVGVAAHWHDNSGFALPDWNAWVAQIRATFEPRMTLAEWCLLVENRRQLPGESGAQYALEKAQICRRCPLTLAEADMIPYLVRGLLRPEHMSVLMNPLPATVTAFVDIIRHLEAVAGCTQTAPIVSTVESAKPSTVSSCDISSVLRELTEAFGNKVASSINRLEEVVNASKSRTNERRVSFDLPRSS